MTLHRRHNDGRSFTSQNENVNHNIIKTKQFEILLYDLPVLIFCTQANLTSNKTYYLAPKQRFVTTCDSIERLTRMQRKKPEPETPCT